MIVTVFLFALLYAYVCLHMCVYLYGIPLLWMVLPKLIDKRALLIELKEKHLQELGILKLIEIKINSNVSQVHVIWYNLWYKMWLQFVYLIKLGMS